MFGRRRRPLLRAAMVGGVAYHAGKRRQDTIEQDEVNEARLQQLEAQQTGAPSAPAGVPVEQLKQIAELRAQGVLSEQEFEQQKRRLLQGS
jgi:putative oligomerization/nucleic acid binding protein